jgi:hypothetical protein
LKPKFCARNTTKLSAADAVIEELLRRGLDHEPAASFKSSAASLAMDEVTMVPLTSILTWVVAPFFISTILPLSVPFVALGEPS